MKKLDLNTWRENRAIPKGTAITVDSKLCTFYVPSPVEFAYVEQTSYPDKTCATILQTDIAMLFNQTRLDRMTAAALTDYLDQTTNWRKQGNVGKYTPEQLSMFVKSRYCQSPSELMAWTDYLNMNYDSLTAELQAMVDSQNDEPKDKSSDAPAPSPAPTE